MRRTNHHSSVRSCHPLHPRTTSPAPDMLKKPSVPLSSTVGRALSELVIIVAGVLIALAAQSWWENRRVEEDRDGALTLLHDDLARLESSLRDTVSAVELDATIHRLLDERPAEGDSLLGRAVANALFEFGFEIGARDGQNLLPAYADLKSSGRLGLLPDTVRARMPAIELQLVILSRFLDDVVYFQQERVDPILFEHFRIDASSLDDRGGFAVEDPTSDLEIFRDPEIRNRLLLKSVLLRWQVGEWRETADSVGVVRDLIRSLRPDLCLGSIDSDCSGAAAPRGTP